MSRRPVAWAIPVLSTRLLLIVVHDPVVEIHREFCERGKREQSGVNAVGLHWIYAVRMPCIVPDGADLLSERQPTGLPPVEDLPPDFGLPPELGVPPGPPGAR